MSDLSTLGFISDGHKLQGHRTPARAEGAVFLGKSNKGDDSFFNLELNQSTQINMFDPERRAKSDDLQSPQVRLTIALADL